MLGALDSTNENYVVPKTWKDMDTEIGQCMMFFDLNTQGGLILNEYMNENHWMNKEIFLNKVLVAYHNKLQNYGPGWRQFRR